MFNSRRMQNITNPYWRQSFACLKWRNTRCPCVGRGRTCWPSSWPAGRRWKAGGSRGTRTPWPGSVWDGRCSSWQWLGCTQSGGGPGPGPPAGSLSSWPARCRAWWRSLGLWGSLHLPRPLQTVECQHSIITFFPPPQEISVFTWQVTNIAWGLDLSSVLAEFWVLKSRYESAFVWGKQRQTFHNRHRLTSKSYNWNQSERPSMRI